MSNPSRTVLILGARGRFGQAAARAFAQDGWRVLAQARPGARPSLPGAHWIDAGVEDTAALARAAQGASVVVHAMNPPYTHREWREHAPALMDDAIAVTRALGATLMLPGNVYNFGTALPALPALLREDTPQRGDTFKGRLRIELEQRLAAATRDGRMRAVVIRAGDFFGSGTGTWFDLLIAKDLPRGKLGYPGALDVPTAWAYLPDLARAFERVAARRERLQPFEELHFGGYSLTGRQWIDAMSDVAWEQGWLPAGGQLKIASMPWTLMRLLGWARPVWASLAEMQYLWRTPHALDHSRLDALIGAEPHTPLPQAVRAALGDLGMLRPGDALASVARPWQQA